MNKKKINITWNAPVIISFSLACLAVTILGYLTGGVSTRTLFSTYRASVISPMMYLRLFTHILGHRGMAHLMGNLAYILLLGPMLEEKYGPAKVLEIILVTAFVTGLVNNLLFGNTALCGASGVCFAFILLTSFTGFREGEIPLTFLLVAVIYLGQQVWDGITVRDSVSNLSHIVGGLVGAAAGYALNIRKKGR